MEKIISTTIKLSHKQFRAILKKFRRKKIRQRLAKEREQQENLEQQKRESSPGFKEIEEEIRRNSELYDQFEERENIRQHKLWLLREQQAQEEFKRREEKLELERIRHEEERKRILEEFEKQEFVDKQAEEKLKKIKLQKEEALQEALSNLPEADGPYHNPIAPANYNVEEMFQEREHCMFFSKTGCCRFGERCSRGHVRPTESSTILIKGMYSHFSIDQTARDDYDTDIALEYEDKECYQDFKNFYFDVLPEFKKFGKVIQFKVCNNFEPHLRGNVYVQYSREDEAVEAYKNFNGRFYAGKQITCEFTHVIRWRSAICGLHSRNLCPKGMNCNFLHVFRNPNDEYWEANRDLPPRRNYHDFDSARKREDKSNHRTNEHRYRHESRSDRHEYRSDRHESRNDRYESRSDRYESRSDRYEYQRDRHEPRNERHEYRNDRYESRSERNESRSNKYDSRHDYRSNSSSDSCDAGGDKRSSRGNEVKKVKSYNSKYRKRKRDSSSRSASDSSSEDSSPKKKSYKSKKHKKKTSKKHKIIESTVENMDGSCTD